MLPWRSCPQLSPSRESSANARILVGSASSATVNVPLHRQWKDLDLERLGAIKRTRRLCGTGQWPDNEELVL